MIIMLKKKEEYMEAKCRCGYTWNYSYSDIKIEPDGHDAIVVLYCPNCGKQLFDYTPNDLIKRVHPSYVDAHPPLKYTWE